jgi:putative NADH-flavin reductase
MDGVRPLGDFYLNVLTAEKDIDWVFFSPAGAFDEKGTRTGKFRLGKDDLIVDAEGNSHISVQDYAVAMVDELEKPAHHQERFTIGY